MSHKNDKAKEIVSLELKIFSVTRKSMNWKRSLMINRVYRDAGRIGTIKAGLGED